MPCCFPVTVLGIYDSPLTFVLNFLISYVAIVYCFLVDLFGTLLFPCAFKFSKSFLFRYKLNKILIKVSELVRVSLQL